MSEFDDLFNRFFGGKKNQKKNKKEEISDFDEAKNDNIKKLIEMLDSMEEVTNSETAKQIDDNLGEPDRVEYYEEKGMFFEKKVWRVFGGEMVKVIISDEPFEVKKNEPTLTLKEQLDEAIKNEDYEIAANIRDAIKKEEKKQKKLQKNLTK
jgi:hypothetical protein